MLEDGAVGLVDIDVDAGEVGAHDILVANPLGPGSRVGAEQPDRDVIDMELAAPVVLHDGELTMDVTASEERTVVPGDRCDVLLEESPSDGIQNRLKELFQVGLRCVEVCPVLERVPTRDFVQGSGDGGVRGSLDYEHVDPELEQFAEGLGAPR